jgi:hypothetical protein
MQNCRTAREIVYNKRRNKWLMEVKRSLERDKGDGCLCTHRVIGGKLGDNGRQVSVVHARNDVRIGGTRNSGRDEQTRCRDKQGSHSRCSAGSRASPLLQAGVDRFVHLHVAFAHDAGLASIWSSAVARPLTEKLRVRGPLVCALGECEGVRGSINSIARLISGTHAISFALSVVIAPWRSPPGQGFILVSRIDSLGRCPSPLFFSPPKGPVAVSSTLWSFAWVIYRETSKGTCVRASKVRVVPPSKRSLMRA